MPDDTTERATPGRREQIVRAGHRGDAVAVAAGLDDPDPRVRAAAIGATVRLESKGAVAGAVAAAAVAAGLHDPDAHVRRRAALEAARWAVSPHGPTDAQIADLASQLIERLAEDDANEVREAAAFACGELDLGDDRAEGVVTTRAAVVDALSAQAVAHEDHLCRESAVAALGSIGDPRGLPAVIAGCTDRANVRRRAVLALAAFDDPAATTELQRLVTDRDLQVRQAAEELLAIDDGEAT